MKPFLIGIVILYLILCPFYLFPSGMPQPADFIMAFGVVIFLFRIKKTIFTMNPVRYLLILVFYIMIVALLNQVNIYLSSWSGNTLFPLLFYIYNFLAFVLIVYLAYDMEKTEFFEWFSLGVVISIFIQALLSFFGVQKSDNSWVEGGVRTVVFFNNPNQLGYYTLIMFSMYSLVPSMFRRNKIILTSMIVLSVYLVLMSVSRGALTGILLMSFILFSEEGIKIRFSSLVFSTVLMVILYFSFTQSNFLKDKIDFLKQRNEQQAGASFQEELEIRGYDRVFLYPEYLIFGAGEGALSRFSKNIYNKEKEMHSGFGTILFSYGFPGFVLFSLFLFKVIQPNPIKNLLYILPVLLYNLTHQGLRNTLFWIFLALVFMISYRKEIVFES